MPDADPAPPRAKPPTRPPRFRVLAIDDERLIGDIIRRALGAHDVTCFHQAADALAAIRAGARWDVILCDVMMPNIDGLAFYRALVDAAPEQAARLVFMTGGVFSPEADHDLAALARPRLDKPMNLGVLRATVAAMAQELH